MPRRRDVAKAQAEMAAALDMVAEFARLVDICLKESPVPNSVAIDDIDFLNAASSMLESAKEHILSAFELYGGTEPQLREALREFRINLVVVDEGDLRGLTPKGSA
jgi:hypothetical protein